MNFLIKKVNDNVIDVFCDKGWNNWSRFEVEKKGSRMMLKLVKGLPMTQENFKQLYTELTKPNA